ncbi:MAG: EF-P lysine aminoacylase GenX [Planctomycetales bacterium]|nr:EF-P lysine aminoacylase GenX [Planctomycetales bacterium]
MAAMSIDPSPSATWSKLESRAKLLRQVRAFFDDRGFLEVETPLLAPEVVLDTHIEPIATANPTGDARDAMNSSPAWFLQSSPEAHMKRLLAAGAPPIYQISRCFRRGELGPMHNPEFTMLEWYRPGDTMEQGIALLADLAAEMLGAADVYRTSYSDAFLHHAGFDPLEIDDPSLGEVAAEIVGAEASRTMSRDDQLNLVLVERVEPHLGHEAPEIVFHYPASQAALARLSTVDRRVAERFELYCQGIEVANGYCELLDPRELRERMQREATRRVESGLPTLPLPEKLLAAMQRGLPPCSGVALGFDRLVMLAAGVASIGEVLAFPAERA